jgi:tetratricopeptide (TPR) repeat protein
VAVLRPRCAALALALAWTPALPVAGQTPPAAPRAAQAHRDIGTAVPAAQAAFDRGLLMLYAFNVGEARTAFRGAERADPKATLAYFGEAVAETIDINRPTTPDGERRGADAIARGRSAAAAAPDDDRALFDAAAARFDQARPQMDRFTTFFDALQKYADAHPRDGMALTLAAYAGWNATGALTAGPADDLTPDAQRMAEDLDRALALDPNDAGAHHLRIHFWEEAHRPERARADADALAALVYEPGESHLEHMAGHIYDRLGEYAAMIDVNRGACANDDAYFALGRGDGQTYMRRYHDHDVDFVLYGLTTIGRYADAEAFAARESSHSQEIVALRSHDDRGVLRLLGDAVTPVRVVAEAREGDLDAARKHFASLESIGSQLDRDLAQAALARASHDVAGALAAYRRAATELGSDLGDPKLHWWMPVAEGLGATLLEARKPAEAEDVFRVELARYPNDPRLEFGLAEALAAQGKDDIVPRNAYRGGWQGARPLTVAELG